MWPIYQYSPIFTPCCSLGGRIILVTVYNSAKELTDKPLTIALQQIHSNYRFLNSRLILSNQTTANCVSKLQGSTSLLRTIFFYHVPIPLKGRLKRLVTFSHSPETLGTLDLKCYPFHIIVRRTVLVHQTVYLRYI